MAELFGVEVNTVNYHLKEIFKTKELTEDSVIRKIRTTADDGKGVIGGHHADCWQSKKSQNLWDKFKRLKKANKLLAEQGNGRFPTLHESVGSILEHTADDGKSYLQDENYISGFPRKSKELRAENEPSSL
jgi:hypothetical protein